MNEHLTKITDLHKTSQRCPAILSVLHINPEELLHTYSELSKPTKSIV